MHPTHTLLYTDYPAVPYGLALNNQPHSTGHTTSKHLILPQLCIRLSTFVALDKKTAAGQNVKTDVFMVLTNTLHLLIKTGMVDDD